MNTRLMSMRSCEKRIYFNTQAGQLKSTKTPLTHIDTPVHAHTHALGQIHTFYMELRAETFTY